jgi:virginiamycin B lyase
MRKRILFLSLFPVFVFCASRPVSTDVKVIIREYDVPTPNSRPHDPAVAPDGALWYTGQLANKLGRLDPKSGEIKEYPLKTLDSGPHGLASDRDGNIWFTANFKAYIGKLDPRTGDVKEYPMPDPRAKDPHSLVFDRDGMIFFWSRHRIAPARQSIQRSCARVHDVNTQDSNFVGTLDPKNGRITLKEVPTPHALPYGIIIGPDSAAYFCEFGSNKIGKIDPKTLGVTEIVLPNPDARPRRISNNPDGLIYYSDFARGFIGRLDPKTGKVEEWASPGGPSSRPYGIASTSDGTVWYSESGVKPNTVVAFNPKTKSFQSWPIPSGGGVVRNMVATSDDRLYLACSGVNKVAIAEVRK